MMNLRPFQIALLGVFALFALIGLLYFAFFEGTLTGEEQRTYGESVEIWGTFDDAAVRQVINTIRRDDDDFEVVRYTEKDARTFDTELLNAIAEERAPDLIVLPSDSIVTHRAKLLPLSFEAIPQRTYLDTHVDGAEIYLFSNGVYGLPFAVDPLVMYWNRDLFSSNGLANPPSTWSQLTTQALPAITDVTSSLDVLQSVVSFGEFSNVVNAKPTLSLLLLQAGTDIVTEQEGRYTVTLGLSGNNASPPADAALSFYTQFSNPSSVNYSWNRSLQSDRLQFLGGDLALYFGYGSEYRDLQNANPNLNMDIREVPQSAGVSVRRGHGRFFAFAIPRASDNPNGAYRAAQVLTSAQNAKFLSEVLALAPVHRSTIGEGTGDPYRTVLYQSALIARDWLDPDPTGSATVFRTMVEDITSGRKRVSQAVNDAAGRLGLLF